jgi:hypothetical protein
MSEHDHGVRTRLDIKKSLLRRAMEGKSQYSAQEMILLILWVQSRARHIPDEHEKELDLIREVEQDQAEIRQLLQDMGINEDDLPPESRALMRLNAEERRRGARGQWEQHGSLRALLARPPASPSIN